MRSKIFYTQLLTISRSGLVYSSILLLSAQLVVFRLWVSSYGRPIDRVPDLRQEMPMLLVSACIVVHWTFVVCVGGDWMANARFLSHAIPLLLVLLAVSLWRAFQLVMPPRLSPTAAVAIWILGLNCLGFYLMANVRFSRNTYAWQLDLQQAEERALYGMAARLNALSKSEGAVVACSDSGRVGYYFKGNVLDWWGLADEEIARSGQAEGGVDPAVVLRRRPDFIVLYSNEPELKATSMKNGLAILSRRFFENPDFLSSYRQIDSLQFRVDRWHVLFQKVPNKPNPGDRK